MHFRMALMAVYGRFDPFVNLSDKCGFPLNVANTKRIFSFDERLIHCLTACGLNVAIHMFTSKGVPYDSYESFDFLKALIGSPDIDVFMQFPRTFTEHLQPSRIYFMKTQELIGHLVKRKSKCEFQLLIELSIACLRKALSFGDSYSKSIFGLSLVYLAALHYAARKSLPAKNVTTTYEISRNIGRSNSQQNALTE